MHHIDCSGHSLPDVRHDHHLRLDGGPEADRGFFDAAFWCRVVSDHGGDRHYLSLGNGHAQRKVGLDGQVGQWSRSGVRWASIYRYGCWVGLQGVDHVQLSWTTALTPKWGLHRSVELQGCDPSCSRGERLSVIVSDL